MNFKSRVPLHSFVFYRPNSDICVRVNAMLFSVGASFVWGHLNFTLLFYRPISDWAWMSIIAVDINEVRPNITHSLIGWWDLHFLCVQALLCVLSILSCTNLRFKCQVLRVSGMNGHTFTTKARARLDINIFCSDSCKDRKNV